MIKREIGYGCLMGFLMFAAPANSATFDCKVEAPKSLNRSGETATLMPINSPDFWAGKMAFKIDIKEGKSGDLDIATITWPADLINIAGQFPAVRTGKGVVAFSAFSPGPCLFTETSCVSQVHLADQADGSAKLVILPTAIATDRKADTHIPFVVLIEGTCSKAKS